MAGTSRPGAGAISEFERLEAALNQLLRQTRTPRLSDGVRARARLDVDRAAYMHLVRIAALGPIRLSDLAADLGVELSTVSRQIASLEGKGYVVRTIDPDDRRAALIELSAAGRATMQKMRAAWQATIQDLLVDWKESDVDRLAKLLERFNESLVKHLER